MATDIRRPTADNTDGAWTPSTGTDLYACIDEGTQDDSDYIHSGANNNNTCYFNHTAFALGSSDTPTVVSVYASGHEVGSAAIDSVLRINGAEWIGGSQAIVNATPWNVYRFDYLTNPSSGGSWTYDEVNGNGTHGIDNFGVKSRSLGAGEDCSCSWAYLEVTYTPGASGNRRRRVLIASGGAL